MLLVPCEVHVTQCFFSMKCNYEKTNVQANGIRIVNLVYFMIKLVGHIKNAF